MGELLAAFAVQHPEVSVELVENDQAALIEGLRRGDLSLILTYDLDLGSDLEIERLDELRPYALLPAGHPLAQQPRVSLADLASEPMVLLDLPSTRAHQSGYFAGSGLSPRIGHRATSFEMVRSLVANGLGYAILVTKPAHDMSYSGKALASRPVVEDLPLVRFVGAWRKSAAPEASAFLDLCRRHFGRAHG